MAHKPLRVHSVLPRDREASGEVVSAREAGIWVKFLLPNPVLLILKPMAVLSIAVRQCFQSGDALGKKQSPLLQIVDDCHL